MAGDAIDAAAALSMARDFPGIKGMDLAKEVTTAEAYSWRQGCWSLADGLPDDRPDNALAWHVVAYDFGVKRNILRMLAERGCRLTVVPATTPASEVLAMQPDGVFLSNGPGDPEPCDYAITAIRELLDSDIPIFGICLGHQLLSLASGARTIKMKFGHHGANHPVQDLDGKQVMITSQNHGFAVDDASLPDNLVATHRSLFDGSLQGVARTDCAAFSFQGHPEASPGPHDVAPLFDQFIDMIRAKQA
jgi:carbamoyl-phosphate synthase small subunit